MNPLANNPPASKVSNDIRLVELKDGAESEASQAALLRSAKVLYAEPNLRTHILQENTARTPNARVATTSSIRPVSLSRTSTHSANGEISKKEDRWTQPADFLTAAS